jgi:predicted MFS family arabinose efflux permease
MTNEILDKETRPVSYYAWYVLAILFLINVFNYIDRQIISILMQGIKTDLELNDTELGFLTGITFAFFYATFGIPLARLADRWSRRNVIVASLALWSAMTAACGLAKTFPQLLAARTAVAIGEAGCTPPAHSMLTDLFPNRWRVRAIAVYSLGLPVGILVGLAAGGWINQHFSWRAAFMVVGIPGILLALLTLFTIKEPKRATPPPKVALSTWQALRELWGVPSYRNILIATSFNAIGGYAILQWAPSFFIRSHGLGTAEIGLSLGLVVGISGAVGVLGGGWISEHLGKRNKAWYTLVPALAMLVATPFYYSVFLVGDPQLAFLLFAIPSVLNYAYLSPIFASVQLLAEPRTRALAAAILLFVTNLIGAGLGPQIIGLISDALEPSLGLESLRWALCIVITAKGIASINYWLASRTIAADIALREEQAIAQKALDDGAPAARPA